MTLLKQLDCFESLGFKGLRAAHAGLVTILVLLDLKPNSALPPSSVPQHVN